MNSQIYLIYETIAQFLIIISFLVWGLIGFILIELHKFENRNTFLR